MVGKPELLSWDPSVEVEKRSTVHFLPPGNPIFTDTQLQSLLQSISSNAFCCHLCLVVCLGDEALVVPPLSWMGEFLKPHQNS